VANLNLCRKYAKCFIFECPTLIFPSYSPLHSIKLCALFWYRLVWRPMPEVWPWKRIWIQLSILYVRSIVDKFWEENVRLIFFILYYRLLEKLPMKPLVKRTRRSFANILKRTLLPSGLLLETKLDWDRSSQISPGRCRPDSTNMTLTRRIWSNACKFTPSGGKLTIRTKLVLPLIQPRRDSLKRPQSCYERPPKENTEDMKARSNGLAKSSKLPAQQIVVRIEVEDTGNGIRHNDMYKLFSKLTVGFLKSIRPSHE